MEQTNRVELIGIIGTLSVTEVSQSQFIRMTVSTSILYEGEASAPVIETTWHNVIAWKSARIPEFSEFSRGKGIHIIGRIRNWRITTSDGTERWSVEILAFEIDLLDQLPLYQQERR